MSEQSYDILIAGGGFAGLSAALYTARGMKRGILFQARILGVRLSACQPAQLRQTLGIVYADPVNLFP